MKELILKYKDINSKEMNNKITDDDYIKYAKFSLEVIKETMDNFEPIPSANNLSFNADFAVQGAFTERSHLRESNMGLRLNSSRNLNDSFQSMR